MNLRTRLFVSYMIFVGALATIGGWGAWHLHEMGEVTQHIVSDNYDDVVAVQDMLSSVGRQDSAVLLALLGQRERALERLLQYRRRFDASLQKAMQRITELGEADIFDSIHRGREAYYRQVDTLFAVIDSSRRTVRSPAQGRGPDVSDPKEQLLQLEPLFNRLRNDCERLLQLHDHAILTKSADARRVAQVWFFITIGLVGSLVLSGIVLAVVLSSRIVQPVRGLTKTAAKIAGGDLESEVKVESHDEVGILVAEFNRMAEHIRELRRSDIGCLMVAQQTAEAAIDSL